MKDVVPSDESSGEPDQPPLIDEINIPTPLQDDQQRQLLEEGEPPLSLLEPPVRDLDEEPIKRSEGAVPLSLGSTLFDVPEKNVVTDDSIASIKGPEDAPGTASSEQSDADAKPESDVDAANMKDEHLKQELKTEVEETKAEIKDQEKIDS